MRIPSRAASKEREQWNVSLVACLGGTASTTCIRLSGRRLMPLVMQGAAEGRMSEGLQEQRGQ